MVYHLEIMKEKMNAGGVRFCNNRSFLQHSRQRAPGRGWA
jgi:hypothetical protein